jgi:hypothetical protein
MVEMDKIVSLCKGALCFDRDEVSADGFVAALMDVWS